MDEASRRVEELGGLTRLKHDDDLSQHICVNSQKVDYRFVVSFSCPNLPVTTNRHRGNQASKRHNAMMVLARRCAIGKPTVVGEQWQLNRTDYGIALTT